MVSLEISEYFDEYTERLRSDGGEPENISSETRYITENIRWTDGEVIRLFEEFYAASIAISEEATIDLSP